MRVQRTTTGLLARVRRVGGETVLSVRGIDERTAEALAEVLADADTRDSWLATPLTYDEVSTALGVSERTVRRWVERGDMPCHRHPTSRRVVFYPPDVDEARARMRRGELGRRTDSAAAVPAAPTYPHVRRRDDPPSRNGR